MPTDAEPARRPSRPAAQRPLVMGVVNVTPDSFSDGGDWFEASAAIEHGLSLVAAGADILDIGGESTRPGAERPTPAEEMRRVLPVIEGLVGCGIPLSIDTMRAEVASSALEAGAALVNDVSGGLADPEMAAVVAAAGVDYIAMHWRAHSTQMQSRAVYDDVVADVCRELSDRVSALVAAGIEPERIVLDPGFGFAKTFEHNWSLLRGLDEVRGLGHRVLVGTSRKGFLGAVGRPEGSPRPPHEREIVTAVTTAYAATHGAWALRVHDVTATLDALAVVQAIEEAP